MTRGRELGLRTVAILEAAKGAAVLVVGSGLLLLVHRDVQEFAERLVAHLHLNPASRYPRIFLNVATAATPARLQLLALGALLYAGLRFVEAAGLWRARRWAAWFGVGTGLVYVPLEVLALARRPESVGGLALLLNLGIVLFLALQLRRHQGMPAPPAREAPS